MRMNGLVLVGVLVASGAMATPALAALPEGEGSSKEIVKFTTEGGAARIEQKEGAEDAVTCTKLTGTGEWTNKKEGTFDDLFEGCATVVGGIACIGLNDKTSGSILVKGTFKLGYLDKGQTLVGTANKIAEAHFTCGGLILVLLRGCVVGLLEPLNKFVKEFKMVMKQKGGVNEFDEILNATNNGFEACKLEAGINGNAFKEAGLESKPTLKTNIEFRISA